MVGIRGASGFGGNDDSDRSHVAYGLQDIVAMLQLKVVGNVLEGFIEEGSIVWPCIVEGVVLDLLRFSSKFASRSVVVVPALVVVMAVAPLAFVASILVQLCLPLCRWLILILHHVGVHFLIIRLIEMITMNAMIAFAQSVAKGCPCPLYTAMWPMIKHVSRQQTVMQTGSVQILNSMYL